MSREEIDSILGRFILRDGIERDILRDYLMQRGITGVAFRIPFVTNGSEVTASYIINQLNL